MQANTTAPPVSGPEAGFQILQIVALLLPLTGIFLQTIARVASTEGAQITDNMLTWLIVTLFALVLSGIFGILMIVQSGISLLLAVALSSLIVVFVGIAAISPIVVEQFVESEVENTESAVVKVGENSESSCDSFYESYARGDRP